MRRRTWWILILCIGLCLGLIAFFSGCEKGDLPQDGADEPMTIPENAVWLIQKDETGQYTTDYHIIFGTVSSRDRIMALEIGDRLNFLFDTSMQVYRDTDQAEAPHEILFGSSESRSLAKELAEAAKKDAGEDSLVWGFAYRDGKLALYANNTKARDMALETFEARYCVEEGLFVPDDLFETFEVTAEEYAAILQAEEDRKAEEVTRIRKELWQTYANSRLEEVKALNAALDSSLFGEAKPMGESPYAAPPVTPTKGQHPRIMLTPEMLPQVKAALENPLYAELAEKFWAKAQVRNGESIGSVQYKDCVFPEQSNSKGSYHYNAEMLAIVEAKALAYLLTGEEIYGYEAIYGIKNAMLTLEYTTANHMDTYHGASHVFIVMAAVYDWCYDLLTEQDIAQMTGGITNLMFPELEFKFPPTNYNAMGGHGVGPQFFRDIVTISLAFYDELPDWWNFVGGRLFAEYVPVLESIYENGYVSQGANTYGPSQYDNQSWCRWVVEHACGTQGLFPEGMKEAPYFLLSELLPSGNRFPSGDGQIGGDGAGAIPVAALYFGAAVSQDIGIMNYVYNTTDQFSKLNNSSMLTMQPAQAVILASQCPEPTSEDAFEGLDLIRYTGDPGNVLTARNGWDNTAAASWVKGTTRSLANHNHPDTGTFQLYYKGLLSICSGSYQEYGSHHYWYYHHATVGHNGLLIADPALRDMTLKEDGTPKDPAKYYYTGGQRKLANAGTLSKWLTDDAYITAKTLGRAEGYTASGAAEYAYMASDITPAYDASTVKSVVRRMLTVFTDDAKAPMLFFTYDTMDSHKAEAKKTFLLHTIWEPAVVAEKRLVTTTNSGGGMLVMQTVIGENTTIEAIGGLGRAYEINGVNLLDTDAVTDNADKIWGRVEVSTSGSTHTEMLHAMYVTDATEKTYLTPKAIENDQVAGSVLSGVAAIFARTTERIGETLHFTTEGTTELRYYVSGVTEGDWRIKVNGKNCGTVTSTAEGGILSFTAPAGTVELIPH